MDDDLWDDPGHFDDDPGDPADYQYDVFEEFLTAVGSLVFRGVLMLGAIVIANVAARAGWQIVRYVVPGMAPH